MIFSSVAALFVGLSSPLGQHGVAVNHFNLGPRALAPLAASVPLRIMSLGASITYGQASSDGCGYRCDLRNQLVSAGNTVNFVGSRQHGAMKDGDVEGWPGFRIDQVHAKAKEIVPRTKPNVILINVGTNDAVQSRNVSTAGERMESMVEDLYLWSPRAAIILSTLLLNKNPATERNVGTINEQFVALAAKLEQAGRKVLLVDMHGDNGPTAIDLADDTHPNDAGYRKMANIWYAGLSRVSDLGWLQPPEAVAGLPENGEA